MMTTHRWPHCLVGALFALSAAGAAADHAGLHVSGFGTVGAVWLNDRAVFFNHPAAPRGDANRPDFGADSVLGVQAAFDVGERTDVIVQLVTAEDYRGRYAPRVSWAYLRHHLSPRITVRAGRLRAPFFMLSDGLQVNYVHPWVRPPVEVYGLNPFNDAEGVDLLYRRRVGAVDIELQPHYLERGHMRFPDGDARLRRYLGVKVNIAYDALNVQFGHGAGRLAVDYGDPLFEFVRNGLLAAGAPRQAARLAGRDGRARFDSIGFEWDDGTLQLIGEYARRRADRFVTSAHGWHLTAAYRLGALAPFVTLARQRPVRSIVPRSLGTPGLDAYLDSRSQAQKSVSLGVRWDVASGAALKAQWSRTHIDRDAWGAFFPQGSPLTGSPAGRRVDMLGVSLDFVF